MMSNKKLTKIVNFSTVWKIIKKTPVISWEIFLDHCLDLDLTNWEEQNWW